MYLSEPSRTQSVNIRFMHSRMKTRGQGRLVRDREGFYHDSSFRPKRLFPPSTSHLPLCPLLQPPVTALATTVETPSFPPQARES